MTKKTQNGDRKELKDLNLIDNFLFYEMVESEAGEWFCRYLLETVFQRPIGEIQMLPQKNIQGSDTRKRGVRLDIQIEEGQKRMYDLEPDKYTTRKKMPYRSRFYQAIMDSQSLHSGADYEELKDLYIIFIQPFDIFRKNRRIYGVCQENP